MSNSALYTQYLREYGGTSLRKLVSQGPNAMTQCLMRTVNESGKLHMTPALLNETYIMRWCACAEWLTDDDVFVAWNVIQAAADDIIRTRNKLLRVVSLGKSRELSRSLRQHSMQLCTHNTRKYARRVRVFMFTTSERSRDFETQCTLVSRNIIVW